MGVESVLVAEALSHGDTLEISCHTPTRVLLPALESMLSKRQASYRSIKRTFTYTRSLKYSTYRDREAENVIQRRLNVI